MTGMLSCSTDFFKGNKLIMLISSLSSTGSRNIEEETQLVKYRVTLWLLLFSIFSTRRLPMVQKNLLKCSAIVN